MPSFDVVSEIDQHELSNAIDQSIRELSTRFDFKGTKARIERQDNTINLIAEAEFQTRQILDILQGNAAIPNIDLADKVFLSPSPCSRRVKNLEDKGYISRRVSLLDPNKVGLPVTVFIQVTLDHQVKKELDDFAKQVTSWPEVMECYLMTGEFDYLIRVVTPDLQSYQEFLDQRLTQFKGINHVKSSFSLKPICYKTQLPLGHHLKEKPEI